MNIETFPSQIVESLNISEKELALLAWTDELTGLYNRRFLKKLLPQKIEEAKAKGAPLSLFMIDVDKFKGINDNFGHLVGDKVLIEVANLIRKALREEDYPIRYAGDEFAAVLPNSPKNKALSIALEMVKMARDFKLEESPQVKVTLSIGVATFPEDAEDTTSLIEKADKALYVSKEKGRNRASVYQELGIPLIPPTFPTYVNQEEAISAFEKSLSRLKQSGSFEEIFISGEAGFGKSRLLEEMKKKSPDILSLKALGKESQIEMPFYYLVDAFFSAKKEAFENAPSKIKELLSYPSYLLALKDGFSIPSEDDFKKAILSLKSPIFFLFDEAEFIDEKSLKIFEEDDLKRFPILIVHAIDPRELKPEIPFNNYLKKKEPQIINLKPLTYEHTVQLIESFFPKNTFHPSLMKGLHRTSQGVPLLLEEVLRLLYEEGKIYYTEGAFRAEEIDPQSLSLSLKEALEKRISCLDEEVRRVIEEAATSGIEIDVPTLAKMLGESESKVWEAVDKAKKEGVVEESEDKLVFSADTFREEIYTSLSEEKRREFHQALAEALEEIFSSNPVGGAPVLVYHFSHAGLQDKAQHYQDLLKGKPPIKEVPLEEGEWEKFYDFLRAFRAALTNLQLYPPTSSLIQQNVQKAFSELKVLLQKRESLTISEAEKRLLVNGERIEMKGKTYLISLLNLFVEYNINSVTFHEGVTPEELKKFLLLFSKGKHDFEDELEKARLTQIEVNEKVYVPAGITSQETPFPPTTSPKAVTPKTDVSSLPEQMKTTEKIQNFTLENLEPLLLEASSSPQALQRLSQTITPEMIEKLSQMKEEDPEREEKRREILEKLKKILKDKAFSQSKMEKAFKTPSEKVTSKPEKRKQKKEEDIAKKFALTIKQLMERGEKKKAEDALSKLLSALLSAPTNKARELERVISTSLESTINDEGIATSMGERIIEIAKSRSRLNLLLNYLSTLSSHGKHHLTSKIYEKATQSLPDKLKSELEKEGKNLTESLLSDLLSRNEEVSKKALENMVKMPQMILPSLIELVGDVSDEEAKRRLLMAIKTIANENKSLFWDLFSKITSSKSVIPVLEEAQSFPPQSINPLKPFLLHPDAQVRLRAAKLLEELSPSEEIIDALLKDKDPSVMAQAFRLAGMVKSKIVLPYAQKILQNREAPLMVQREAAIALGEIGGLSAVQILSRIFQERKFLRKPIRPQELRITCLMALSQTQTNEAKEIIKKALKDKDPEVRNVAHKLLES
jgi:diguanylate cyclase (GGDEF)-like protein